MKFPKLGVCSRAPVTADSVNGLQMTDFLTYDTPQEITGDYEFRVSHCVGAVLKIREVKLGTQGKLPFIIIVIVLNFCNKSRTFWSLNCKN